MSRKKTFQENVRFRVGSFNNPVTCEEAQTINAKINRGEYVNEIELARAAEHTRVCRDCLEKFLGQEQ